MPLHLCEGIDLWSSEIGKADAILVCCSYEFRKKHLGMPSGYGAEAVKKYPGFGQDLLTYFDSFRKPITGLKANIYGTMLPADWIISPSSIYSGTAIGVWQTSYKSGDNPGIELIKFSASRIDFLAKQKQRVAVEYPSGINPDLLYPILTKMPSNVIFYSHGGENK